MLQNERKSAGRKGQLGVQSVEVAGQIIQVLMLADGPLKLIEIAQRVEMPAAKVHRYLVSLARTGLVQQSQSSARYDLGPLAFQLGLKGFARFEPLQLAEATLADLVDRLGETAALAVWTHKGPTMIRVLEARHDFASSITITHHCPMTFSATGLVFCTFEDPARTQAMIARELEQNRITGRLDVPYNHAELDEICASTRARGFACIASRDGEGYGAVSAPVFDSHGRICIALTVFGQPHRVDSHPDGALAGLVAEAAARLSTVFGYKQAK